MSSSVWPSKSSLVPQVAIQIHCNPRCQDLNEQFTAEFPINDYPTHVRDLFHSDITIEEIRIATGCSVEVKGTYVNEGVRDRFQRVVPLHLYLKSFKREKVECAVAFIVRRLEEAMSRARYQERLLIGLEDFGPGFDVITKIGGNNGSNMMYISHETGANLVLRGRGSGYIEPLTGRESSEPLHLLIEHDSSPEALKSAYRLAHDLVETVREDWYKLKQSRSSLKESDTLNYADLIFLKKPYEDLPKQPTISDERINELRSSTPYLNNYPKDDNFNRYPFLSVPTQDAQCKEPEIFHDSVPFPPDHLEDLNKFMYNETKPFSHRKSGITSSHVTSSDHLHTFGTDYNDSHDYKVGEKRSSSHFNDGQQNTVCRTELSDDEMPNDPSESNLSVKRIKTVINPKKSLRSEIKLKLKLLKKSTLNRVEISLRNFAFVPSPKARKFRYVLIAPHYEADEFTLKIKGEHFTPLTPQDVDFIKNSVETDMLSKKGIEISAISYANQCLVVLCRNKKTFNWLTSIVTGLINPVTKKGFTVSGVDTPPPNAPKSEEFAVWINDQKSPTQVHKLLNCNAGFRTESFHVVRTFKWESGQIFIFLVYPNGVKWLRSNSYRACCGMGTVFFFKVIQILAKGFVSYQIMNESNSYQSDDPHHPDSNHNKEPSSSTISIADQEFEVIDRSFVWCE